MTVKESPSIETDSNPNSPANFTASLQASVLAVKANPTFECKMAFKARICPLKFRTTASDADLKREPLNDAWKFAFTSFGGGGSQTPLRKDR